jgi:hypothetical protein
MQRLINVTFCLFVSAVTAVAQMKPVLPPAGTPPASGTPAPSLPPMPVPRAVPLSELAARIFRIPKKMAVRTGPDRIRTTGPMRQELVVVGEEGDVYLARFLPPEDEGSPLHRRWLIENNREFHNQARVEYYADKYLATDVPDVDPPFTEKLAFERRDQGLPTSGHWQMSFDVADFNGDGLLDLVLPPARLGVSHPSIYLQQPDGTWRLWDQVRWPATKFDYGSVRVADFDGDGNLDIALTCHFGDTLILYGNGKGDFTRMVRLPKPNPGVSARALTVADFNNDGRPDVATICEMDLDQTTQKAQHAGLVVVYLNLPDGWKAVTQGFPTEIQGDWLSAADIDGDGWVDLLLTSRKEGVTDLFMRNVGKGTAFQPIASTQVPQTAFILANAAAPLDRSKRPDVVLCFQAFNPFQRQDDPTQACAIYRFHDAKGKLTLTPKPEMLIKREVVYDNFKGVAIGDIDGDGRNDIAVITSSGAVKIFLQFPDGKFYQHHPEIKLPNTDLFDVRIVDLHHSGMGDVIVAGSPSGAERGGGVWVFSPHLLGVKSKQVRPALDNPVARP